MTLKIFNTFSKSKVDFVPVNPADVKIYACGPTVYDRAHIGNARPVVIVDILVRFLRLLYPKVTYARNITDIDDKIIKASQERGISIEDLTQITTSFYHEDMASLKALAPDLEPRATENVDSMIGMIQMLIDRGHAYEAQGHVLFQVSTYDSYGCLSRRSLEDMLAGARVEVAPYKREAGDFVLWKPSEADQPGWNSPWGRGRPGWHIECSAMIRTFLGYTIDIHAGGCDLIFPHHENERAQSLCSSSEGEFVKYWLHNGHVTINKEKMSKSLGNFFTVRDLLDKYPGEVMRLALLSAHYRQPLDWTPDLLNQAQKSLDKFYGALQNCGPLSDVEQKSINCLPTEFMEALEDDLNTPQALACLHGLCSDLVKTKNLEDKQSKASALKTCGWFLGLLQDEPCQWFDAKYSPYRSPDSVALIEAKLKERDEARQNKDFEKSDRLRDELKDLNVIIKDSSQGTTWCWKK